MKKRICLLLAVMIGLIYAAGLAEGNDQNVFAEVEEPDDLDYFEFDGDLPRKLDGLTMNNLTLIVSLKTLLEKMGSFTLQSLNGQAILVYPAEADTSLMVVKAWFDTAKDPDICVTYVKEYHPEEDPEERTDGILDEAELGSKEMIQSLFTLADKMGAFDITTETQYLNVQTDDDVSWIVADFWPDANGPHAVSCYARMIQTDMNGEQQEELVIFDSWEAMFSMDTVQDP